MHLDVSAITRGLTQDDQGIWRGSESVSSAESLSYPDGGHDVFFGVEEGSFWFQHRNACLVALLERWRPEGTLLDVGGGNGYVCRGLVAAGIDAALLEPGPAGAANAKACGIGQVLCTTLEAAKFRSGSLPAAGLFDVLEHIETEDALLGELHRVLVPNGLLVVTVPGGPWLWSDDDVHAGHFRRYTLSGLEARLRQSGFEIEYSGHLFAPLIAPLFLLKALPSKFGVRSKNDDRSAVVRDHQAGGGLTARIVSWLLAVEQKRVAGGRRLPFGTSIVAVARRRSEDLD